MHFSISKGKLLPLYSTPDSSGLIIYEYPSLKNFDAESIQYLISRINATFNKRLKARYGLILSNTPGKNKGEYIKIAIDVLIDLVKSSTSKDHQYYSDFSNLIFVSLPSKYRGEEVKKMLLEAISKGNPPYDEYVILVPKMLALKKFFARKELTSVAIKGEKMWKSATPLKLGIYERIAEQAIRLSNILAKDTKTWYNRLGELFELSIDLRKDDETGMMPLRFCEEAIRVYQLAGNRLKVKQLLTIHVELKANLKLSTIEYKFTSKKLAQLYRHQHLFAKRTTRKNPDSIIGFLSKGAFIFPAFKALNDAVSKREKSFLDFANLIKYDINKNSTTQKFGTNELTDNLNEEYNWYLQVVTIPLLRELFKQGLYNETITYNTITEFLHKRSWIGKNIIYRNSGGEAFPHNWLAMIAPAIFEFFYHWKAHSYAKVSFQNLILPIDSLTLKFEGILRDFARVIKADTLVTVKGNIREAHIEDLLANEKIRKYFTEDDLFLFKYLFTATGINIRNNVAHAFYKFHQYRLELMLLILMAILRISKYQIDVEKIVL